MWSSCLPVAEVDSAKPTAKIHPFPVSAIEQPKPLSKPVEVTKCPPWTAEDEYRRSGSGGKTFAYQWGWSSQQRAAIPHFDLDYYDGK